MDGLMMDYPLTLAAILRRAETVFPGRAVVSRSPGGARRTDYAGVARRSRRLAAALPSLGLVPGDRVATLCMNHQEHLELYFGVPAAGAVLHTLNPRLPADDLAAIASHAGDRILVVDERLLPVLDTFRNRAPFERVVVVGADRGTGDLTFEELVAAGPEDPPEPAEPDESRAALLCYTSGTTGRPRGVLYSHRALVLHSLTCAPADSLDIREADTVMPVVPMFHVNAWGLPFTCAMMGAAQVLPGSQLDASSLLGAIEEEGVTIAAGVPTVWLSVLHALDAEPGRVDVSRLRSVIVGGSAAPQAMMAGFERRHGVSVLHAWGMTEMTPVGTVSRLPPDLADADEPERDRLRATQGRPVAFVEVRARGEQGLTPWDGSAMGELEVRGPAVASSYFAAPEGADRFTGDGWFRTGDVVRIDERAFVEITDREKDLVKSGGEWISSVALENALMAHPAVAEACVIAVPHPTWGERPLACVVLRPGEEATPDELVGHLADRFPRWWLPDRVERVDAVPRTATGKFLKAELRVRYRDAFGGTSPDE